MVNKIISRFFYLVRYNRLSKIDENLYVFVSYYGKYADGPKYISEKIHRLDKTKKIVWLVDDLGIDTPRYIQKIKYNSFRAWINYSKAKAIIDNTFGMKESYLEDNSLFSRLKFKFDTFLKNKKNQKIYTTWHGTPLKKIGVDQIDRKILDFSCPNTTLFLGDMQSKDVLSRITFEKIKIEMTGSPRNEFLLHNMKHNSSLKKQLKIDVDKKVILFAPSFREGSGDIDLEKSGLRQLKEIDVIKLLRVLKERFGNEWVFVCRFHYHVDEKIDWKEIKRQYGDVIVNGNFSDDMADYLAVADVLLTDVSSCMFDYMATKKPVFLYFPDLNEYSTMERGLYIDIRDLPFSYAKNPNKLYDNILKYDDGKYKRGMIDFEKRLGYINDTGATERIAKKILKDANNT